MHKKADGSLTKKRPLRDWFPKVFMLEKKIREKAISDSNRHKRLAKKIYIVFKGREPWIPTNEGWRAKYFEKLTQVQVEKLNII